MLPYATKVSHRKIHIFGERSFFWVASIADVLSIVIGFFFILSKEQSNKELALPS